MTRTGTNWAHGASGYRNYGCRCEFCKTGHAADVREYRRRRRERTGERILHGRFVARQVPGGGPC